MKKAKFHWATVGIHSHDHAIKVIVKALVLGDTGLCVNQFDPTEPKGKFISVTHVNTGKRVCSAFNEARTARQFCEAVAGVMDWTLLVDDENLDERFPNLCKQIRELRAHVVEHRGKWKEALVTKILNEGSLTK